MATALSDRNRSLLAGDMQPKFLATISDQGEPNVVPLLSLAPLEEPGFGAFAEFMMWKTKANLKETGRLAILALDAKLRFFTARGEFRGFVNSGPIFDAMATQSMFRYNPYNGIRSAGTFELPAVDAEGQLPAFSVLAAHVRARRMATAATVGMSPGRLGPPPVEAGPPWTMPALVAEKYGRLKALKAIAWPAEIGVRVLPACGVAPVGRRALVIVDRRVSALVPEGTRVAVTVITMDPTAYQVKGRAHHWRGVLLVDVTETYTAGPPVPGRLCPPAAS